MPVLHQDLPMLRQSRAFLVVIQEGSLRSAANRLGITQPALSRQMQTLEHELGGRLLERTSTGVKPTKGGHALADNMAPVIAAYERAMVAVRRQIKGETGHLRIGFLASAAREYLDLALKLARKAHPDVRLKLFDLTPGEQYQALRADEIDVGLVDESARLFGREFYHRRLTKTKVWLPCPLGTRWRVPKRFGSPNLKGRCLSTPNIMNFPAWFGR